jgi:hypothetical protein
VVFGLDTEVLENRIRPESFHVVPILDLTVSNGVVDTIAGAISSGQSLIANEEIQVLSAALHRKVRAGAATTGQERRLVCDRRPGGGATSATSTSLGCNGCWKDEGGRIVTGESYIQNKHN